MRSALEECDHTIGALRSQLDQEQANASSQIHLLEGKIQSMTSQLETVTVQLSAVQHYNLQASHCLRSTQHMLQDAQGQKEHFLSRISTLLADWKHLDTRLRWANAKISNPKPAKLQVKVGGIIADDVRHAIMDLYSLNIASNKILEAIRIVTDLLGVELVGTFSASSVLRIVGEGGVASEIQVVRASLEAKSKSSSFMCLVFLLMCCSSFFIQQ